MLSAAASEFVPTSFLTTAALNEAEEDRLQKAPAVVKPKKTKEMRGPRKRQRKKGDNCSVSTSISQSQYGDEEDDAISHLSLEGSYLEESYDNDGFDNLSYNHVSYPNTSNVNDQINPLARQRRGSFRNGLQGSPDKMSNLRTDMFGRLYGDYMDLPSENEFLHGAEGDWVQWFDNVCEQFGRSASPDNSSLSKRNSHRRTPSECSQDSWLDLQQEWVTSKQLVSESDDFAAEELERKKWGEWAMHASETERQRRIAAIEVMDVAQDAERAARGKWALEAIERERNDRISAHFLVSLASTNWFNETISAYSEDYELVCPYYRMGCKVSCRRSTLEKHLGEECIFARQIKDMDVASKADNFNPDDYEIICPNAFMGCTYTCNRKNLHDHMLCCSFNGISKERDLEERQLTKQAVIQECEDERTRRQKHLSKGSGYWSDHSELSDKSRMRVRIRKYRTEDPDSDDEPLSPQFLVKNSTAFRIPSPSPSPSLPKNEGSQGRKRNASLSQSNSLSNSQSLHHLLRSQVQSVVASLHDETAAVWAARLEEQRARRPFIEAILSNLRASVAKLWHFCRVETYGSYSTGLSDSTSDLDLVVCFSDECQSLLGPKGVVPLLHLLAEYLAKEAGHLIHITNVIIHARVPIIKAVSVDPQLSGAHPNNSNSGNGCGGGGNGGSGSAAGFTPLHCEGSKYEPISIDISIDSPLHSGLATTEMVCTLMQALPPLGPVVSVVKDYLKLKGLSDAFTGGLNSYGLFILMLLPLLRRLRDSRDLLGCEPIGGVPVPAPATAAASATSQASSSGTGCPATVTVSAVPATANTIDSALTDAASNSKVHVDKVPAPTASASTRATVGELKPAGACQRSKQGAVGGVLVASHAKCIEVDLSSAVKGSAPSSLPDNAVKGSDRKAPVTTLTAQDTGRTCDCDNGLVKGPSGRVNRVRSICLDCSSIKAGTAAAAVVVSDKSSSNSNNRHLEVQTSDDSQGEGEAEAEAGDAAVKVSSSKASDQQGGGGKVTSVYMQAVARAAQAQSQRMAGTSTKGGHLAKGSLNKRLKEMNLTIPTSSSASSSSEGEDTVVRDAIPVPLGFREKERGSGGIHCIAGARAGRALSSIQAGGSATCSDESAAISDSGDIELSLESIGGDTTLPLSLNTSVDSALSPASPPPSTPQGEDTNKHSQLPSSLSASPSSKPMLSSRPPLRPTPPVTLKEYLSVKHSLHSTYTVARSALKPSQSSNVPLPQSPPHQPSPASPKYKPSSPSSTASAPSSSSVSTPPKASGPSYDTSPGIALHCSTVNVKSFPAVFTNTHASSGAMATYQYLRPKPPSPFSRQHNISPIATPKQSLGQMQLSSNAKFPMRIIFPSPPPFSSPYKHSSGPSSSSISKAGALYIMNVMNNQRGYTWNNLKQQRDFGRKVAFKLFDLPDNGDFNRSKQRDSSKHNYRNSARDMRVPCVLALEAPILGSLLQDFLLAYGEELQCGKHGYSARDYGFRFDIDVDVGDLGSVGGRSDRSERSAGDCHVYPTKEEKDRVLEKDKEKEKEREKDKEKEREKDKDKEKEGEKVNREQVVEPAPLPAIEIEIPCDEMMRECIFVPIPLPLPIPIHPHAGDPLLVEDPVNVMNNVTKNCYKAPAVQKSFFEALERFKGIAVRRRPLNSSSALSPVNSRMRFQFPAPAVKPSALVGPHLMNHAKEHSSRNVLSRAEGSVAEGSTETSRSVSLEQAALTPDASSEGHVGQGQGQGISTSASLSQSSSTPLPTLIPSPPFKSDPYSLIQEIFGVNRRASQGKAAA